MSAAQPRASLRRWWPFAAVLGVALGGLIGYRQWQRSGLEARLVREDPERVVADPALVRLAASLARPVYARECASCHGANLEGPRRPGVPALGDAVWLYGFGSVTDIETTILYGIRSGHPKARNITDMPAFGRVGQLSPAEIHDVVEFVYGLSHQDVDRAAARRGNAIFGDKGVCYDCHGPDASGNIDYGAPDLTGRTHTWLYGGDRADLTLSVTDGRHGLCPAWIWRLRPVQIRALAVYLYEVSQGLTSAHPGRGGSRATATLPVEPAPGPVTPLRGACASLTGVSS